MVLAENAVDNAATAELILDTLDEYGAEDQPSSRRNALLEAQVRATLALVEQQRIANLIAAHSYLARPDEIDAIGDEVRAALGYAHN